MTFVYCTLYTSNFRAIFVRGKVRKTTSGWSVVCAVHARTLYNDDDDIEAVVDTYTAVD